MIHAATILVAALATSAAAADVFGPESLDLVREFEEWKASEVGQQAIESGFVPTIEANGRQEGAESEDAIQLERFQETKKIVEQLNKEHPEAEFSVHNPLRLLS
ncbi:hypothetical protein SDRG_16171 [Saprolegnia diclina VS20]|uniref:Uncharacterized protein n=1 Tax=Saprolegnia diclina (strain VS20) TaxID=1156394 RepID=T0R1W5_SAPDV|nr:hypothetical protein SDRG_16171 [Saprolegnia diclina VS20]EQC25983.1 hypothetical protein SDRG_16171 [Saprolegnia diclina VS20]|eukprot:XP_008620592.1 hypothetical protein SDRG_16171 [Saprolegnia diclina VS20]